MTSKPDSIAADVSALFRRLGAAEAALSYKEFDKASDAERAIARWPLLGRIARMTAAPSEVAAPAAASMGPVASAAEPVSRPAIATVAAETPLNALFRQIGGVSPAAPVAIVAAPLKAVRTPLEDFLQRTERL